VVHLTWLLAPMLLCRLNCNRLKVLKDWVKAHLIWVLSWGVEVPILLVLMPSCLVVWQQQLLMLQPPPTVQWLPLSKALEATRICGTVCLTNNNNHHRHSTVTLVVALIHNKHRTTICEALIQVNTPLVVGGSKHGN